MTQSTIAQKKTPAASDKQIVTAATGSLLRVLLAIGVSSDARVSNQTAQSAKVQGPIPSFHTKEHKRG